MDAAGEETTGPLRLQFDRSIKLAFCGSSISSDGGLLLHRELDDALGLTDMAAGLIGDPRTGKNGRHRLASFLRQSVFSRCYRDHHTRAPWKHCGSTRAKTAAHS